MRMMDSKTFECVDLDWSPYLDTFCCEEYIQVLH